MGNITNIIGGAFEPQIQSVAESPQVQIIREMQHNNIQPPDDIIMDGQIHRFRSGTKGKGGHGDKTGWYVFFNSGIVAGTFGCWRAGVEIHFKANIGRTLTVQEEMAFTRRMSEAKALRDAEIAKSRESSASIVETIWNEGTHATKEHGYLVKKNIKPHGARVTGDGRLMLPLLDTEGKISSIQYISVDGDKKYHPSGATGERFWSLGDETNTIYIAEGFATAATIHEVTGKKTIIAYSASNLVNVTKIMVEQYPKHEIVIVADNDDSGTGLKFAYQARDKFGVKVIAPPILGDANDYFNAGGDLSLLLAPHLDDWLVSADDFSNQPAPISWLVKGWVQDKSLVMVHGPSGGGKTFLVLDWCMSIASSCSDWFGNKAKDGQVVYLAGEGHHGLRGRIAAWKQHNNIKSLDMWLSKAGCDLNTLEGYNKVLSNLKALSIAPTIIVVDTLHRFLLGDENSSQDAKTMLDACSALIQEFNCTVLLVHHTGVSEESQHRARGSSAWRGALDIEVSVVPSKNGSPIEIVQRKSKDAELVKTLYCELKTIPIDGWLDEDGLPVKSAVIEQVEAPVEGKKDSKLSKYIKLLSDSFEHCGAELIDGFCYFSKSALMEYLVNIMGYSENTAKDYMFPSRDGKFINELISAQIIEPFNHGFLLKDAAINASILLRN